MSINRNKYKQCGFCERRFDCVNESRPGVTSKVLTPVEAVLRVDLVKSYMQRRTGAELTVACIAEPGDPLANPRTSKGKKGAQLLLHRQVRGLEMAAKAGMMVKVNHVDIPGVNDHETLDLALKVRGLGAVMMNIVPLIPVGKFKNITPPDSMTMDLTKLEQRYPAS